jgi:hypothetical protein
MFEDGPRVAVDAHCEKLLLLNKIARQKKDKLL